VAPRAGGNRDLVLDTEARVLEGHWNRALGSAESSSAVAVASTQQLPGRSCFRQHLGDLVVGAPSNTSRERSTSASATSVDLAAEKHREKHLRWRNLAPPRTRALSSLIYDTLVPALERRGFRYVGFELGEPADTVAGSEIHLERKGEDCIDSVRFNFEKYRSPRFQVHLSRRKAQAPHDFVRSGNLVARNYQYYHFWGKPWWIPTVLWPERAANRAIETINMRLEQAMRFIEHGVRDSSISKEITISGARGRGADDA